MEPSFFTNDVGAQPASDDLGALARVMAAVSETAAKQTITRDEADLLRRFFVAKFVERRVSQTVRDVLKQIRTPRFFASSAH